MIGLTLIRRSGIPSIPMTYAQILWRGRSIQSLPAGSVRGFSTDENNDNDKSKPTYPLPKEKSSEPPSYLKRGSPLEISMRSERKNEDPRPEEEKRKEFWNEVEQVSAKMAAKGFVLVGVYPGFGYFEKKED